MSDRMIMPSVSYLFEYIITEHQKYHSIFQIPVTDMPTTDTEGISLFDSKLSIPVGPAAGPHSQMAHNIISAYVAGARFFELKTVQKLDSLEIEKPCIDARDECYNTEWSTELSLEEAFTEYAKAWLIIHELHEFFYPESSPDFIFNMSVGYDLQGIKTPKMQHFIDSLINARSNPLWTSLLTEVESFFNKNRELPKMWDQARDRIISKLPHVPAQISNSVTLSTMHGCPPAEIESISSYLIQEKKLNTYIKLNPTLLGYDLVSNILLSAGFVNIELDPLSFANDLQFSDAIPMIQRLTAKAEETGLEFGVKLSNTLAVKNREDFLPGDEQYMSGRSLYPLTIKLAEQISRSFNGQINISFSGGANQQNISDILKCGIYPVTVVTDLLKPGGYQRLRNMAHIAAKALPEMPGSIDLEKLNSLAENAQRDTDYTLQEQMQLRNIDKTPLDVFDCAIAPCVEACPIHQDIPAYIELTGKGKYEEALKLIYDKNPLPNITGYICDHQCQFHCTRNDYESPVKIREIKRIAAERGASWKENDSVPVHKQEARIAIIGAGPSGLAAAYFLRMRGYPVTIFEKEASAGGVIEQVLPRFRIPQEALMADINHVRSLGVEFHFSATIEDISRESLFNSGYKYIYLAIGAGREKSFTIEADHYKVTGALPFLKSWRDSVGLDADIKNIAIIGGGNTAMDSARVAKKYPGINNVYIIYRRTTKELPADREEFDNAINDGVKFVALRMPVSLSAGVLRMEIMELGEIDSSGRKKPQPTGKFEELPVDLVVRAIGESVDADVFRDAGYFGADQQEIAVNKETLESGVENVYIGGDARTGPATVVEAIADARRFAESIVKKDNSGIKRPTIELNGEERPTINELLLRRGKYYPSDIEADDDLRAKNEAERCLHCDLICNKCVEVCPNRANVPVPSVNGFKNPFQIIHLDDWCNECGNCATFCPHDGKPYIDKFTLFSGKNEFDNSSNPGMWLNEDDISFHGLVRFNEKTTDIVYGKQKNSIQYGEDFQSLAEEDIKHLNALIDSILMENSFLLPAGRNGN